VIKVLSEKRETPAEIERVLRVAGGLNRFGDPNYKAVWGRNRLDWICGNWEDRDDHGLIVREVVEARYVPKYAPLDRWHIEKWFPPESYGPPEAWWGRASETELGPYPSRGDYEHCFTVETPEGGFLELTPAIARHIARAIETSRNLPHQSLAERKSRFADRNDRDYDSYADSVLTAGSTITGPMVAVP